MEITFDQAVELLEITDISKLTAQDIPKIVKKAKKRWHPDNVAHLNDANLTADYNIKFQEIDEASDMILSFLQGTYQTGTAFANDDEPTYNEPEEIIRENANDMQETLKGLWSLIKEKKYKWSVREVTLSDGFKLGSILNEDFKEDIAKVSIISFFYGCLFFGLVVLITGLFSPFLRTLAEIIWLIQALACIVGFSPLSRLWLPTVIQEIMFKLINFGLAIYNWANDSASHWLVELLVQVPVLFAYAIKYIILFPLYELAKAVVGDKTVGVVKRNVNYYADAAEWYIDELMTKDPLTMSSDELLHLSYVNSQLSDVEYKL